LNSRFKAFLLLTLISSAAAQQVPAPDSATTPADSSAQTLTSTEQGRTTIADSFKSRRAEIGEERRHAFADTELDWQFRTYDLDRLNADDSRNAAWAVGGSAGLQTGLFRNLVSFGAIAYTSQPLYAPAGEGGTKLLTNDQAGYTVLGQVFAQFRISDDLGLTAGRREFETPYLSSNDTRMTPQTFEGVALQGTAGDSGDESKWRYGVGYFDKEKAVNSEDFVNMARIAGANVDRPVDVVGLNYQQSGLELGAIEYYSPDVINIFYTEASYDIKVSDARTLKLHAQYTSQKSVGDELLTGGAFSAYQFGGKAELATDTALLTAAYTETGRGTTMRSPWSGFPGYTSVQYGDFDGAGENAFMLRAARSITALPGFSMYALWVRGTVPQGGEIQNEYDGNLQWSGQSGVVQGLMFRARYAYFTETNKNPVSELRLMLFYTPKSK
jgi:hypothetical protein